MKLICLFLVLLTSQIVNCGNLNRNKRGAIYDYLANKTISVKNYVINKARSLKEYAVASLPHSYYQGTVETMKDKAAKITSKVKYYINKAEKTASTLYDNIAPEKLHYDCEERDPANEMTTPELITLNGYTVETHVVITEDGFMLSLHRIPYSKKSGISKHSDQVVLLHHGLLASSADWVLSSTENSLGFVLSDAGYDVWMANARGNVYSRAHINKPVDTYAFWNFTFHEIGYYDLPAAIDYIKEKKGNAKINYVGFSMGTTVLFTLLSTRPEYNKVLNGAIALAPVAYMSEIKSPFKLVSKFGNTIERFSKLVGANEFLPRNAVLRYLAKHSCKVAHFEDALCDVSMFIMCGHDKEHFDRSLMPKILGHVPAGASTKTLAHFSQEINNGGRFQQYDYGIQGNLRQYGLDTPPEYNLANISLPIYLISAEDDWLSSLSDARNLSLKLPNVREHYIVDDKTFNHLDFVFAKDVRSLVYDKILRMLEELL